MCHVIDSKEGFCYAMSETQFVGIKRFRIIDGKLVNYFTYSPTKWKCKRGLIVVKEKERKQKIYYGLSAFRLKSPPSQVEVEFDGTIPAGMHVYPFRIKSGKLDYEMRFLPEDTVLAIVTFSERDIVFFDGIDVSVREFEIKLDQDWLDGYASKALYRRLKEDLVKLKELFSLDKKMHKTNETHHMVAERRKENE